MCSGQKKAPNSFWNDPVLCELGAGLFETQLCVLREPLWQVIRVMDVAVDR